MNINGVVLFYGNSEKEIGGLIRDLTKIVNGIEGLYQSINTHIDWSSTADSLGCTRDRFSNLYYYGNDKELAYDLLNRLNPEIKEEDVL